MYTETAPLVKTASLPDKSPGTPYGPKNPNVRKSGSGGKRLSAGKWVAPLIAASHDKP
jgi:hypothetical protein